MRHATWTSIEASPFAMRLYRSYRRLPPALREPARWLTMPRWNLAAALVQRRADNRVMSGPFKGMTIELSSLSRRKLLGYILGSQEIELHDVVERIVARGYPRIVNVGAADGYYAIGLLRRLPQATLVAFEALPEHHPELKRTAALNGVATRLRLEGFCQLADLNCELETSGSGARARVLVVADIEGGEMQLLDPSRVPALRTADMLVETHDAFVPGCTEALIARFASTHTIERIVARPRTLADFPTAALPELAKFLPRIAVELMNERRQGTQQWLYLAANSSPGEAQAGPGMMKASEQRAAIGRQQE